MEMKAAEVISLYQLIAEEERAFLDAHQTRVKFYTTIVSAILAATIAGVVKVSAWYHVAIMCIGPLLVMAVAWIAIEGTKRLYQRWLWSITIRAKLEQLLEMTQAPQFPPSHDSYWSAEPIVSPGHIGARQECPTSAEFVEKFLNEGYNRWTRYFFYSFIGFGGLLLTAMIWLTIYKIVCQ